MIIERLAHTCFVVHADEQQIVFDPAMDFYNNMWMFDCTRTLTTGFIQDVSAIFISHSHVDHFHIPTLFFANRDLPIYLPIKDQHSRWPMRDELLEYGFQNILYLKDWETVTVSNLKITGIPAPDSIEGIPQISFLVESPTVNFLNTVDTLEEETIFQQIKATHQIDILTLPVNCSYNHLNIRNQMSPGTAIQTVELLNPSLFIPTGINFCHEKKISPVAVPMFPYDDTLNHLPIFQSSIPSDTVFLNLKDHHILKYSISDGKNQYSVTPKEGVQVTLDTQLNNTRGRMISHLTDVFYRDEYYFGYQPTPPFTKWRKMWVDCLDELFLLGINPKRELEDMLVRIPIGSLLAPIIHFFPMATKYISTHSESTFFEIVAESLMEINHETSETDYVKRLYHILRRYSSKRQHVLEISQLEYLKYLQFLHIKNRPIIPTGIKKEQIDYMMQRQLKNDMKASHYIYPKLNPIYSPIKATAKTLNVYSGKTVLKTCESIKEILFLPAFQKKDSGNLNLKMLPFSSKEKELVFLLLEEDGNASIEQLCARYKYTKEEWGRLFEKIMSFEPFAIDFHWYPGTGYQWNIEL
ncbi:MBL fold metallo-hydrolase [Bacillus cereus]|nr:MBL fold metallo-hydrolase [Bacillus cereus]